MTEAHIHFIPVWKPGETRYAGYAARNHSGLVENESVDVIKRVAVGLLSDQLRSDEEYTYFGAEFDRDVKYWVESWAKPEWYGGWRPFEEGVLWDTNANIRLNFESDKLSSIPLLRANAVLSRGGETLLDINLNNSGQRLESGQFIGGARWELSKWNSLSPDRLDLILEYPASNYSHTLTWRY